MGLALLTAGCTAIGVGLFLSVYVVVALSLILLVAGGMSMFNPAVTIQKNAVVLKNLFGMEVVSYDHDGLHTLSVVQDTLRIQHQGRQALIPQVTKSRCNGADWQAMVESLAKLNVQSKS